MVQRAKLDLLEEKSSKGQLRREKKKGKSEGNPFLILVSKRWIEIRTVSSVRCWREEALEREMVRGDEERGDGARGDGA